MRDCDNKLCRNFNERAKYFCLTCYLNALADDILDADEIYDNFAVLKEVLSFLISKDIPPTNELTWLELEEILTTNTNKVLLLKNRDDE